MNSFAWRGKRRRTSDHDRPSPPLVVRDEALAAAIAEGAIELRFQPQIEPVSGRIVAVEALARWTGEPDAEALFRRAARARLEERLSRLVQRQALRQVGQWRGPLAGIGLSLNIIAEDLERDDYPDWLLAELVAAGVEPDRLTLEIVESSLIADRPAVAIRLARLRAAGIRIAIDDFGTGYSCLAYLTALPIDKLKIDRALIADLVGGSRDRILVKALIRLAAELGLDVIVEGVESRAQLQYLAEWGCDLYQGFLGAGALDEVELARFVEAANSAEAA